MSSSTSSRTESSSAPRTARADWDQQFQAMAKRGDDRLLDGAVLMPTPWDETEWEWPSGGSTSTS